MKKKDLVSKEIDAVERDAALEKYKTALRKVQLINEIKSGLGEEIKKNPNKVRVLEKKWYQKIGVLFKRLFTKF